MNIHNNSKFSSNLSREVISISMENQIFQGQAATFDPLSPLYALQPPSSSSYSLSGSISRILMKDEEEEPQPKEEEDEEELGAMKEMMFKIAAMQPVDIDPVSIMKPKRRNVRISDDPQSVAARNRRQRISEKMRILQRLVPGGTKMDTAAMLDEAIRYIKFLKRQIRRLQSHQYPPPPCAGVAASRDWLVTPPSKALSGGTTPLAIEQPPAPPQYGTFLPPWPLG